MTISAEWKKASCGYTAHQTLLRLNSVLVMKIGLNFRAEYSRLKSHFKSVTKTAISLSQ